MPVLFVVVRTGEDALREFLFQQFTVLVAIIRQHVRKYLEEILTLVYEHWQRIGLLPHLLALLEQLSRALHDEFRFYMPDILPLCVGALAEAERKADYESVGHVLHALEVFSSSVEEHLHLVLPGMVRLFQPGVADVPLAVRRMTLQSLRRLLPRMQLTGYASAIVHPLARCLDSSHEELRKEAADVVTVLGLALGPDFGIFVPMLRKSLAKHKTHHPKFEEVAARATERGGAYMVEGAGASGWAWAAPPPPEQPDYHRGPDPALPPAMSRPLKVNEQCLKRAWESSQRSTKEDW
jgi:FKBP12-rapamycin complex-associated protein